MKKTISLILSLVMVVSMLQGLTLSASAAEKTAVDSVMLTSDIAAPVYNTAITNPTIEVDYCDADVTITNGAWSYKSGEEWTRDFTHTTFIDGYWRYSFVVTMDSASAAKYAFVKAVEVYIGDKEWTVSNVTESSCTVTSPEYTTHNWESDFTTDSEATCTVPGSKSIHCRNAGCTEKKDVTTIPAKGHAYVHGICQTCGEKLDGDCGDYVTWFFDNDDSRLEISGEGDMRLLGVNNVYTDLKDRVKTVVIGEGITSVCLNAFSDFKVLHTVILPSTVTEIGANAFSKCTALKNVTMDSVTSIGSSAFRDCTALETVALPAELESIGANAFSGCTVLKMINMPDTITSIGTNAFDGCTKLSNVDLSSALKEIPASLFRNCTSLSSIEIKKGVTYIQTYAFSGCSSLVSVTVPGTLKQVGYKAFGTCKSLARVNFMGCEEAYNNIEYSVSGIGGSIGIEVGDGNEKFKNAVTTYADHSAVKTEVTTAPTCTKQGVKSHICEYCDNVVSTEPIAATGKHNWVKKVKKATTSANGAKYEQCTTCNRTRNKTTIARIASVKISPTVYTYNGDIKKPSVTVKNSSGTKLSTSYYSVSYAKGRKNVGKYTVTIKFKGNYSGTVKKTFTIKPKTTSISSLTAKSKGFTVKWKKQATQTTGYQIQYSTSSKFSSPKTVTITKNSTTSKTIAKLKAKKKYFVRIRTYRTAKFNGKSIKLYSSWSKSKAVITKK